MSSRAPTGDLVLDIVQRRATRAAAGRLVHTEWQRERGEEDPTFRAEVRVREQFAVGSWTAIIHGRLDGLCLEAGRTVVEEVKSTALDAGRLAGTTPDVWPRYADQLRVYLWMLDAAQHPDPVGRLVMVSLSDGSTHIMGVALDREQVGSWVRAQLERLVAEREQWLRWMTQRRAAPVRPPHEQWRTGQQEVAEAVEWGLDAGHQILVEAPTGMGKTAAVLTGVLRHAYARDLSVFWATSRTTQQAGVFRTLAMLADRGAPLRAVAINAREKVCLNDVVLCRGDVCAHAAGYFDKLDRGAVLEGFETQQAARDDIDAAARAHEVCPFQLALDLTARVDVVVGDYNYAFDPSSHLRQHFSDAPERWIVVVDEAHQLVDRARGWWSPALEAAVAARAAEQLEADGDDFAPFAAIAWELLEHIEGVAEEAGPGGRDGLLRRDWDRAPLLALADRVDELAVDYALLRADLPPSDSDRPDAYKDMVRALIRFRGAAEEAGDETVSLVGVRRGDERLQLLALDPSPQLGPRIGRLSGFVALSATLSPSDFYRDLLGLDRQALDVIRATSPFPPENRRVLVAPRVSTAWKDRAAHADATARLIADCARAVGGNTAVYFPSFQMLRDIASRWELATHEILLQEPGMSEEIRAEWLQRLSTTGRPVVLGAVLGGIFAEGIDLPAGALSAVCVAGPAFPPIGTERDLLRGYFEQQYGDGFLYASLIPGMTRVLQAAGRLVRRPEDRGVVVLVGRRFRWRDIAALLPADWAPEVVAHPAAVIAEEGW